MGYQLSLATHAAGGVHVDASRYLALRKREHVTAGASRQILAGVRGMWEWKRVVERLAREPLLAQRLLEIVKVNPADATHHGYQRAIP